MVFCSLAEPDAIVLAIADIVATAALLELEIPIIEVIDSPNFFIRALNDSIFFMVLFLNTLSRSNLLAALTNSSNVVNVDLASGANVSLTFLIAESLMPVSLRYLASVSINVLPTMPAVFSMVSDLTNDLEPSSQA